jgi:hypothetical protein
MTRGNRRFQGRAPLAGDDWLKANMPPLISFANAHAGVIFITWDEGSGTNKMPFLAVGPGVGSKDRQHVLANRRGVTPGATIELWARRDSNPLPPASEAGTLSR